MEKQYRGILTEREEFLYPDSELRILPEILRVVMPINGKPGIQLLVETEEPEIQMYLEGESFTPEWYQMKAIPVEYNTGDGEHQGGAMVLVRAPEQTPEYVTRKAPFFVYDCLLERADGRIQTENGRAAVYFCLHAIPEIAVESHVVWLVVRMGTQEYRCCLNVQVYDVRIPEHTFWVTNWFSEEAICRFHQVQKGSQQYEKVLKNYIRAMRRIHQNVFFIQLDEQCVVSREPYRFDFEYLTAEITSFFKEGMQYLELGSLLDRGVLPDGTPNMYTDQFTCSMEKEIPVDSEDGYEITVRFVQSLASYLKRHGWDQKVLFHVHDEPDIHYRDQETLDARRRQYYLAVGILRKYLPDIRIIEAVDSATFRGGIDIWVPGTAGYEKEKDRFDHLIRLGETVWTYVCCGPEGHWLNRFLDFALIKGRLLFWGCAKNRISGFLHWGLNQFPEGMNPYEGTSCPNHTGIGTNFPCGDSFLLYPGLEGPNLGMRAEAQRRGAEDVALWQLLRSKDSQLHDELIGNVFTSNEVYQADPEKVQSVYETLLECLQEFQD